MIYGWNPEAYAAQLVNISKNPLAVKYSARGFIFICLISIKKQSLKINTPPHHDYITLHPSIAIKIDLTLTALTHGLYPRR